MDNRPALQPGQPVAAQWEDGHYYLGRLFNAVDGGFVVQCVDGEAAVIPVQRLVPVPLSQAFAVGTHVLAKWKTARMFPGMVTSQTLRHCTVAWMDGDEPLDVPVGQMTFLVWVDLRQPAPRYAGRPPASSNIPGDAPPSGQVLNVFVPGEIRPVERGDRFADPMNTALSSRFLGRVTDEGTELRESGGLKVIRGCHIQVSVCDVELAMPVLRRVLAAGRAPTGTIITHAGSGRVLETL